MAKTKETKMFPEQQEKMTQEVMASLQSSTYGKDYAQEHSSFFEEVENSDLEVVTENVAATTSCMEDELTNEAQSPPNPLKRISGKQRKATLEEYQQTFLQVPRIDDRKPVFVSSEVRDRLDRVVRILGGRRMSVSGIIENIVRHHLSLYLSCSCMLVIRYTVYSWYIHFLRPSGAKFLRPHGGARRFGNPKT